MNPSDPDQPLPPWLLEVLALAAALKPGSVNAMQVLHDDGCPQLTGGQCRCTPDYRLASLDRPADDAGRKE